MMHHTTWINILRNNDSGGKQGVYSQIRNKGRNILKIQFLGPESGDVGFYRLCSRLFQLVEQEGYCRLFGCEIVV